MKGKQRAYLRSLANSIQAKYQIGKNGIDENLLIQLSDGLEANELIKVHVLENAFSETSDVCHELASLVCAEEVQVIGSKFVLYKESKENKRIDINKLIVKEDTGKKDKKQIKPLHKAKAIAARERKRAEEEKKKRNKFFKEQRRRSYSHKG